MKAEKKQNVVAVPKRKSKLATKLNNEVIDKKNGINEKKVDEYELDTSDEEVS